MKVQQQLQLVRKDEYQQSVKFNNFYLGIQSKFTAASILRLPFFFLTRQTTLCQLKRMFRSEVTNRSELII